MNVQEVRKYYDDNSLKEWERLEKNPLEFIFTTYKMDQYIQPGDSILDIGGGPGRYSIHYAQKGCGVTLVDLSEKILSLPGRRRRNPRSAFRCLLRTAVPLTD